jgi:hypothetical protein
MFQHFILTRFNLRKKGWDETKSQSKVLTDRWMENRLKLFEQYCYSSIKSQTVKNFEWLVFFDTNTPEIYREKINELASKFSNFIPIYTDGMENFYPSIKKEIASRLTAPFLITTRLDNDDSLHQDFVKEVQNQFSEQSFMAIDFVDGYTLQVAPRVRLGLHSHVHNPFMSLIEKSEDFKTIWCQERHGYWSGVKELTPVRGKRMWMSIIHFENKVNEYKGYGNVPKERVEDFNLHPAALEDVIANVEDPKVSSKSALKHKIKTNWKVNFKLMKRALFS